QGGVASSLLTQSAPGTPGVGVASAALGVASPDTGARPPFRSGVGGDQSAPRVGGAVTGAAQSEPALRRGGQSGAGGARPRRRRRWRNAAPPAPPPGPEPPRGPPPGPPAPPPGPGAPPGPPPGPVHMNLFATWEVDRSSPSCVPRLFSLTLRRLALLREVPKDRGSVVIAVKLQGSKRILRSNEIPLPPGGPPETELQLTFSLQYGHFLKRDTNRLQVMLQRRKRSKHRPFLGWKTLAVGLINLAEVLQLPSEAGPPQALVLHRALTEPLPVAEVGVVALSSQPVEPEGKSKGADRSPPLDQDSEEDEESFSSEPEGSDDALPGQDLFDEEEELPKGKKPRRKGPGGARHPNIKQKFVALLKRFRVSEEGGFGLEHVSPAVAEDLDALYDSLEIFNPSDSGADLTTPTASWPFFEGLSQSSSQTEMGTESPAPAEPGPRSGRRAPEEGLDPEGLAGFGGPPGPGAQGNPPEGAGAAPGGPRREEPEGEKPPEGPPPTQGPRRALWEQLGAALGPEPGLPESIVLVSTGEWQGQWVSELLQAQGVPVVATLGGAELQAALGAILTRIQRLCHLSPLPPRVLKVAAVGGAGYHGSLLRAFVRHLGTPGAHLGPRGPDWLGLLRFLIVPLGPPPRGAAPGHPRWPLRLRLLDPPWRELFTRSEAPPSEPFSVAGRILSFVAGAGVTLPLPVAEAMLTCSDGDTEGPPPGLAVPSTSPPAGGGVGGGPREAATPPASPSMAGGTPGPSGEALGLQVDYWGGVAAPPERRRGGEGERREGGGPKSSLRGTFRSLLVTRLPPPGDPPGSTLAMTLVSREKNKKVPALFKRPREPDKSRGVEGITRLICAPRPPPALLSVTVDGTQWDDIKFFQLAAQWPSHVKHFPWGSSGGGKAP
ncbi:LOW QUALITY PROTEIN: phosphofurin acidic cluster sorting protein 1-like, partial [Agelaius phoeniceus]|uniref:LOW QUALITY PROTEIN: phosphofurin acidic cluster sorting protein 1-like n=1 Tax=Agelaius phoeniceus TaxID=39638 RepID=UPI004054F7FB